MTDGAVYVFIHGGAGWMLEQRIADSVSGSFGAAVALRVDELWIGAPSEVVAGGARGAVRRYHRDAGAWSQSGAVLTAPDGAAGDQ